MICIGLSPLPVRVTTRIITFLVGNPYKPSFTTVTGRGPHPISTYYLFTCMIRFKKNAQELEQEGFKTILKTQSFSFTIPLYT